jgi:curli biogenesis system outer membrane secretion channel CsgG
MLNRFLLKPAHIALLMTLPAIAGVASADDNYSSMVDRATTSSNLAGKKGAIAVVSAAPKTPATKTITSFSQSLRCMDELFLQYGKRGIVLTSAGIPDETGKARVGSKEMLITALSKMTLKSRAFDFIDFHRADDDLGLLFGAKGNAQAMMPDYYIRGSVTQMDDNAVRTNKGAGLALPFLDLGVSKDESFDVISMDMSVGEAATRRILPETSTSNTMILTKGGKSGEAGGKVAKMGLSFNLDISKSEGIGAASRTLIELGLIETLGKFTHVPYWRCLDADSTNPAMMAQAQEWFEEAKENDLILFVQRKLAGMNRYKGPLNGAMNADLKNSIAEYQAAAGLIADGRINFDLYYSMIDDIQNQLASLPEVSQVIPKPTYVPAPPVAQSAVPFSLIVGTDKGDKPTYHIGDSLNMNVSVTSTGSVYCYYEDATKSVARIFPNQFYANPRLNANTQIRLPSGGFKIKFDKAGAERVTCLGSDLEVVVPGSLVGLRDLVPLPVASLDEVVAKFKAVNPALMVGQVDITIR